MKFSLKRSLGLALALVVTSLAGACGPDALPLVGTWTNQFSGTETITADTWDDGYNTTTIISWDGVGEFVITQNAANADYYPSKFNKIAYTELGEGFAYCFVALDQPDEQAAATADDTSDRADMDTGCGGYPWTQLTRVTE